MRFLQEHELFGDPSLIRSAFAKANAAFVPVKLRAVRHVFPVVLSRYGVGMLVPLFIVRAATWEASDAFASFQFGSATQSPMQGLEKLLKIIERCWAEFGRGALPLRWRTAFAISIGCPVHFEAIGGQSLQLPLVLALLREICTIDFGVNAPSRVPFGDGPVFSTGTITETGSIGEVHAVEKKLEAFVREAGSGTVAVLTQKQYEYLSSRPRGIELLARVDWKIANSISELLKNEELRQPLETLTGPPHPTEIDSLLTEIQKLNRNIGFRDAAAISGWLLPHVKDAPYRWELLMHSGLNLLHRGEYRGAEIYLGELEQMVRERPAFLGVDACAMAAAALASLLFDKAEPLRGLALLESVIPAVELCSVAARTRVFGEYCQLLRSVKRHDEAVKTGEEAFRLAKAGLASEAGRDLNYLIHALLRRAGASSGMAASDLSRARALLLESQSAWAPKNDLNMRAAHLGFCQHYEAELARLSAVPYTPAEAPSWTGDWGHSRLFVLLSAARNKNNALALRLQCAEQLVAASREFSRFGPLFQLLTCVYEIYDAHICSREIASTVDTLESWCRKTAMDGAPGWENLLGPVLKSRSGMQEARWIEELCDAVPYH